MAYAEILKWVHLLGAAVWLGGLVTVGALVPALRTAGMTRDQLRVMARRFGRVSWVSLVVIVATGVAQVEELDVAWSDGTLSLKLSLVAAVVVLALLHQATARRTTAAVRGIIQGLILGVSIAVFAVAVTL